MGRLATALDFVRHRMTRPFRFYLTSLLLIAIVPAFIFSLVVLKRSVDAQEQVITALLQASTGSVTRIVERDVEGMLTTLKVLSTAPAMEGGDMEAFYRRASTALADTDSYLIVIDRKHDQLMNTRVPFRHAARPRPPIPPPIERAFTNNGAPLVSNVFFGQTAEKWVFNVYLPAKLPTGEEYLLRSDAERREHGQGREPRNAVARLERRSGRRQRQGHHFLRHRGQGG